MPKEMQYFGGENVVAGMLTVPTGRFWKSDVEYLTEAKEVLPGVTIIPTTSALMGTWRGGVDVRAIAATNRDLRQEVDRGHFRQRVLMMRIESGKYSAGMSHPHWGLSERGKASFRDRVSFSQPFAEPPRLIIAISGLDIRTGYPTSVTAETERAAVDGFGLRISTAYGGVQEVTLTWVAIGAA